MQEDFVRQRADLAAQITTLRVASQRFRIRGLSRPRESTSGQGSFSMRGFLTNQVQRHLRYVVEVNPEDGTLQTITYAKRADFLFGCFRGDATKS